MSGRYSIIYADPPWQYRDKAHAGKRGVDYKYPTMTIDDICRLDVASVCEDNAALFMWATMPLLAEGLRVMESWGFTYKTVAFVWVKTYPKAGTPFWGMGSWTRANAEIVMLGIKGRPKRISASVHQIVHAPTIEAPIERHSKKPDIFRDRIVELMGDVPRLEMFARQAPEGWDTWGNEVDCSLDIGMRPPVTGERPRVIAGGR
ncbi:MAG: MT-A70 family methyltransferase [Bradymonadia bacterium]